MSTKHRGFRTLVGGALGDLDYFAVAGIVDNDAAFGVVGGLHHTYFYDASLSIGANNSPYQIIPDDNGTGTGAWVLSGFQGAMTHVRANLQTDQSLLNDTTSILIFTTEVTDLLGEYNNSTGVFSPVKNGWYNINSVAVLDDSGWALNQYYGLALYKDSTDVMWGPKRYSQNISTHFEMANISTSIYCLSTEELTIRAYQNSGDPENIVGLDSHTWLTIDGLV